MEIRCAGRIVGVLLDNGLLEVKCPSRACGKMPGVAVYHYFDPRTGALVETKKYNDPQQLFNKEKAQCR